MPKKKFYPPNDTGTQKRRFRCLLFQRPKAYAGVCFSFAMFGADRNDRLHLKSRFPQF